MHYRQKWCIASAKKGSITQFPGAFIRIEKLNFQNETRVNQEPDNIVSSRVLS